MKILVMSLLRLGDIVLAAPAIRAMRDRYPEAKIDLLINGQFRQIRELMPYIDQVHEFDRETIQKGLGDATVPVFESYERLANLVDQIDNENYDLIFNLTHSRLSGWLLGAIQAQKKHGLILDSQGRASFGSNWFRYLNNQVDAEGREVFHFSDVFRFAVAEAMHFTDHVFEFQSLRRSLNESEAGRAEVSQWLEAWPALAEKQKLVVVQTLTSDMKKNWGLAQFERALSLLDVREPGTRFAILAAPSEQARLQPFVENLRLLGIDARLAPLSFAGAFSLLKKADLLITGDTSIKHLASAAGTRTLEISIGSSDLFRTGAYGHGSVILHGKETCAPCPHSSGCFRTTHACAARVKPEAIAMVGSELMHGRTFQLRAIADEFSEDMTVYQVEARGSSFWAAHALDEPMTEAAVSRWVDLTCRKMWLNGLMGTLEDRTGSEVVKLQMLLRATFPVTSDIEMRHVFADLERQVSSVSARLNGVKSGIRHLHGHFENQKVMAEFVRSLIVLRERMRNSAALYAFQSSLDNLIEDDISPAFVRFRRIVDSVGEIEARLAIQLKVLRSLQSAGIDGETGVAKI
jgi:ADP-heptose:LPS heptosyltransferase